MVFISLFQLKRHEKKGNNEHCDHLINLPGIYIIHIKFTNRKRKQIFISSTSSLIYFELKINQDTKIGKWYININNFPCIRFTLLLLSY